jgi:DHA2 family multidrug resistance protein
MRGALRLDGLRVGLLAIVMGSLQIMLDKGQKEDWFGSRLIVTLAVLAGVGLTAFVIRECFVPQPLVRFRLLRYRTFTAGNMLAWMHGFVFYGTLGLLPLFMQTLPGWTAEIAGIWTSPRRIGTVVLMPFVGYLLGKKLDAPWMLTGGFALTSLAFFGYSTMNLNSGTWGIFWYQIFQGAGMSFVFRAVNDVDHGADSAGRNGIRDQPVQRNAQHRIQRWDFVCDYLCCAAGAVSRVDAGGSRHAL